MTVRLRNEPAPSTPRPLLAGRLRVMATTRPIPAEPQTVVVGQLGRGKSVAPITFMRGGTSALACWLYLDALPFAGRPVVVVDEAHVVGAMPGDVPGFGSHCAAPMVLHHPTDGAALPSARKGR